jgi:hypothetical protein
MLEVPSKVQMFIWRLAHNSLPVGRNVARRGIELDTLCPVCKRLDEDCGHLFFKCKYAKQCWRLMDMEHLRIIFKECQSGKDTINMLWSLDKSEQLKVVLLLWRWWSARNKANQGRKMLMAAESKVQSYITSQNMENCTQLNICRRQYKVHGSHLRVTYTKSMLMVLFTQMQEQEVGEL